MILQHKRCKVRIVVGARAGLLEQDLARTEGTCHVAKVAHHELNATEASLLPVLAAPAKSDQFGWSSSGKSYIAKGK